MSNPRRNLAALAAVAALSATVLSGCSNDQFAADYAAEADQGYVAGDGSWQVFPKDERQAPVRFDGTTQDGQQFVSDEHDGEVLVVNFWYAACPPCRVEAKDLQAASEKYADDGVQFVGVNVYDQASTATSFMEEFGVTYPSILDVEEAKVRLAFADNVPPQAIPSTLVLDRDGSVAAVIRGVANSSVLDTMISDVLAE